MFCLVSNEIPCAYNSNSKNVMLNVLWFRYIVSDFILKCHILRNFICYTVYVNYISYNQCINKPFCINFFSIVLCIAVRILYLHFILSLKNLIREISNCSL